MSGTGANSVEQPIMITSIADGGMSSGCVGGEGVGVSISFNSDVRLGGSNHISLDHANI